MTEPRGEVSACPAALPAAAVWFALPGAVLLPFVWWQSPLWGVVFALLWAGADALLVRRVAGTKICWDERNITLTTGVRFYTRRCLPRVALTGAEQFSTPLLRRVGCACVLLHAPGTGAAAFCLAEADARRLCALGGGVTE